MTQETILEARGLTAGYRPPGRPMVRVVEGVDERLYSGELVCLIGPNGAGKSTLLRTIAGMQPALDGGVLVRGQDINQMRADERARLLSIVLTQKMDVGLFTGYGLVSLGRHPYTGWMGRLTETDHVIIRESIRMVGAQDLAGRHFNTMSDGERQKIMIARALAQQPEVMILDEPTAYLDLPRRVEVMYLLRDLAHRTGRTILLSTHDLELALRSADRLWLLPAAGPMQVGVPEDLVLSGAFQTVFESAGVHFDITTGAFRRDQQITRPVTLKGEGVQHLWTRRALEREGFDVCKPGETDLLQIVIDVDHDGGTCWWVIDDETRIACDSISALTACVRARLQARARTDSCAAD
ncbi:MAG: ABC transporter ATP-binding protein [Chloroflexota bacterium]